MLQHYHLIFQLPDLADLRLLAAATTDVNAPALRSWLFPRTASFM